MEPYELADRIRSHLTALTRHAAGRPVGSAANREAEDTIAAALQAAGFEVERQGFDCIEWRLDGTELWLGDGPLPATANPFSSPCDVTAPMVAASSLEELERASLEGKVAMLHGALASMPLFPKNYPLFAVEEHQRIIELVEKGRPHAVIMASPSKAQPAPLIEDGDFTLPSITVPAHVGQVLLDAGGPVTLRINSTSKPGRGANVIGRRPYPAREKLVLCAHFDTKPGTPGALDNASGVAAILAVAERLSSANPAINLEVVAFNGEDHYAAPGEVAYINGCGNEFGRIALLINVDGVGWKEHPATVAFFNCDTAWSNRVRKFMRSSSHLQETEPWPESDHSIFAMRGVACLALTSAGIHELVDGVIHTPGDTLDLVDASRIATVVEFLTDLVVAIGPPPVPVTHD